MPSTEQRPKGNQFLMWVASCCWWIGFPILWFALNHPFDRDLYNTDPYLWKEKHGSWGYGLLSFLLLVAWMFVPIVWVWILQMRKQIREGQPKA